jgi:anti-sigma regulatory factor (Ser/Thr protein kinase)
LQPTPVPIEMTASERESGPPSQAVAGPSTLGLTVSATPSVVADFRREARAFALANGADHKLLHDISLAVSEAVTNVVKYAYYAEDHPNPVRLSASAANDWLEFAVSDQGRGFREGHSDGLGLGLSLIAKVTAELAIDQGRHGTEVRMRFALG